MLRISPRELKIYITGLLNAKRGEQLVVKWRSFPLSECFFSSENIDGTYSLLWMRVGSVTSVNMHSAIGLQEGNLLAGATPVNNVFNAIYRWWRVSLEGLCKWYHHAEYGADRCLWLDMVHWQKLSCTLLVNALGFYSLPVEPVVEGAKFFEIKSTKRRRTWDARSQIQWCSIKGPREWRAAGIKTQRN